MHSEDEIQNLVKTALDLAYKKFQEKKFEIVCVIAEQIIKIMPNEYAAMQILGLSYSALQIHDESIKILSECLEKNPDNPETLNDLALCESNRGLYEKAILLLEKAIQINPEMSELYSNLGLQYRHKEQHEKAIECFNKALQIKPIPTTYAMMGGCYGELKQLEKAKKYIKKAIEMKPDFAAAHVDLASILKLQGKWPDGFEEYEWRYDVHDQLQVWKKIYDPNKRWHGEEINGKRIIIHTEQGHGDAIHFVRYLKPLKDRGAYVILHCNEILQGIFSSFADEIFTQEPDKMSSWQEGNRIPKHEYHCPMLSLPHIFKSIYTYPSYIKVDRKFDLSNYKDFYKIGIVWAGNPQHPNDRQRSCKLELFRQISEMPNVKLFSLMKDTRTRAYVHENKPIDLTDGAEDMKVVDLRDQIHDFEDTAAIINSLDLVIGVDTAVMHLVGAMGKPSILLLPWNPDWRWELEGSFTIWYGNMHIIRQKTKGDWEPVFDEAKQILENYLIRHLDVID